MPATTDSVTVKLGIEAVQLISALCAAAPGVETGGLVVLSGDSGFVTGPGPAATQKSQALEWDASYIVGVLDAIAHAGTWRVHGRWHKHTSPVILASEDDQESAQRFRQLIGADELVDVIVACDAEDRPIGLSAYLCTADEYRRVDLELEAS
jgi:hypothetical protein